MNFRRHGSVNILDEFIRNKFGYDLSNLDGFLEFITNYIEEVLIYDVVVHDTNPFVCLVKYENIPVYEIMHLNNLLNNHEKNSEMITVKHFRLQDMKDEELDELKSMMVEYEKDLTTIVYTGANLHRVNCTKGYIDIWINELIEMNSDIIVSIMYFGNSVAGYVNWTTDPSEIEQSVEINEVYVKRPYRRKGVAEQGLRSVMTHAKTVFHIQTLTLEVYSFNVAAVNLYNKLGFNVKPLKYTLFKN